MAANWRERMQVRAEPGVEAAELVSPEVLEPIRRELRIADRGLNVLVSSAASSCADAISSAGLGESYCHSANVRFSMVGAINRRFAFPVPHARLAPPTVHRSDVL